MKLNLENPENDKTIENSQKKMTKYKLLIYQKMLNIVFSVLGSKIRSIIKSFQDQVKLLKINSLLNIKFDVKNEVIRNFIFCVRSLKFQIFM